MRPARRHRRRPDRPTTAAAPSNTLATAPARSATGNAKGTGNQSTTNFAQAADGRQRPGRVHITGGTTNAGLGLANSGLNLGIGNASTNRRDPRRRTPTGRASSATTARPPTTRTAMPRSAIRRSATTSPATTHDPRDARHARPAPHGWSARGRGRHRPDAPARWASACAGRARAWPSQALEQYARRPRRQRRGLRRFGAVVRSPNLGILGPRVLSAHEVPRGYDPPDSCRPMEGSRDHQHR